MVKIAHLADIHIKDNRRDEYSHIFNKLYLSLKEEKPNIIVVAGDIFDNKSRASANNINDVILFFKNLVNIAPTVVITGNHDTNCTVPGSLDLLTPILNDNKVLSELQKLNLPIFNYQNWCKDYLFRYPPELFANKNLLLIDIHKLKNSIDSRSKRFFDFFVSFIRTQ